MNDHRTELKIDKVTSIIPPGTDLNRAMLSMVRHPANTIFINTQDLGLYSSSDDGETWTHVPVDLADAPPSQQFKSLGVSSNGRMWLLHQSIGNKDLFVSYSDDNGQTWKTTPIDYAKLAPGAPENLYATSCNDYNTFIERPDGTMAVVVGLRYDEGDDYWNKYQLADSSRPGLRDVLIRSTDGGESWGDPTLLHQHCNETSLAVDPDNPERLLAMTRIQRMLMPGEDRATVEKITGCKPGFEWPYKNGLLLESTDGGRSFNEVPGGLTVWYGHRGTILWTERNVVVVTHAGGRPQAKHGDMRIDDRLVARISIDGGKTWADGTKEGTPFINESTKLTLAGAPPSRSFTAPTLELSPHYFLTVSAWWDEGTQSRALEGIFWHLETPLEKA